MGDEYDLDELDDRDTDDGYCDCGACHTIEEMDSGCCDCCGRPIPTWEYT